jgi:steroid delta-isomerase-like uncharacterized protein
MRRRRVIAAFIVAAIFICGTAALSFQKNGVEQNKMLARRAFEEIYGEGKIDLVDQLYAEDFVDDSPGGGRGRDTIKQAVAAFHRGAPDLRIEIEDIFGADDKVVVRYIARGTHCGEYIGIPATGKPIIVRGITIFLVSRNKIQTEWTEYDRLGLMQQLGVTAF